MNKKRAQVTLFIILGIMIVVSLIIVFMFRRGPEQVNTPQKLGPRGFMDKCVRDVVEKSVNEIMASGGVPDANLSTRYMGENYTYLCYQGELYKPCYILYPILEKHIEELLKERTTKGIQECFDTLSEDFENRGYDVIANKTFYNSIDIRDGRIEIELKKSMIISGHGTSQSFNNFDTRIDSPLKEIIRTAQRILVSEATYCYFDTIDHMLIYPDQKITRTGRDGSKLYNIESRSTGLEFKFAVRGCVYPPGLV